MVVVIIVVAMMSVIDVIPCLSIRLVDQQIVEELMSRKTDNRGSRVDGFSKCLHRMPEDGHVKLNLQVDLRISRFGCQ